MHMGIYVIQQLTLTRSLAIVNESLQHMNQPIQLLGNVIDRSTTWSFLLKEQIHIQ